MNKTCFKFCQYILTTTMIGLKNITILTGRENVFNFTYSGKCFETCQGDTVPICAL